jgi:hypothetical protein
MCNVPALTPSPTHGVPLLPAERAPSHGRYPRYNPHAPSHYSPATTVPLITVSSRLWPQSRASMNVIWMASKDSHAGPGQRGSMVLYRLVTEDELQGERPPPPTLLNNPVSVASSSGIPFFFLIV